MASESSSGLDNLVIDCAMNSISSCVAYHLSGESHDSATTVDLRQLLTKVSNDRDSEFYSIANMDTQLMQQRPWTQDLQYFKNVYVSSLALMKMTIHADSGGDIEVMGMLLGKVVANGIVVMDTYSLPVEGTETRVNAQNDSYEYMVSYLDHCKKLGYRNENIVGWYHSHPGYGCWLSGIDVSTERLNQGFQDPYLAIVVDPKGTKKEGVVEIGAFRTFPEGHVAEGTSVSQSSKKYIPSVKMMDFGAHSAEYYSLNITTFQNIHDKEVCDLLLESSWINGITDNRRIVDEKLMDKLQTVSDNFVLTDIGLANVKSNLSRVESAEEFHVKVTRVFQKNKLSDIGGFGFDRRAYDFASDYVTRDVVMREDDDSDTSIENTSTISSPLMRNLDASKSQPGRVHLLNIHHKNKGTNGASKKNISDLLKKNSGLLNDLAIQEMEHFISIGVQDELFAPIKYL